MNGIAKRFLCLLALLACLASPASLAQNLADDVGKVDILYVRVYFDDLATARKIAITFEPTESEYEKGYLLIEVSYEDYQRLLASDLVVEIDHEAAERYARMDRSIPSYACYRTVEETFAAAQTIVTNNPTLATWTDIGNSWEKSIGRTGYDIYVLKLTNSAISGTKPKLLLNSGLHAREYTPVELSMRFAEQLVAGYGTDADATWLIDHHEIHLVLQSNPDGRKKAEAGASWRKNVNENYCGATSSSRGADLNRNFTFMWGCCNGSSTSACNETYRGPSAASEPETQALQSYMAAIFPDQRGPNMSDAAPATTSGLYIDIHSSGRLVLWPWGMTTNAAPNSTALQTLGRKLAYFNNHSPGQAIGLGATDGATDDHCYGTLGIASYTFELGTSFFETCSYFTDTLLPANLPSLKYAAKAARAPYQLPAGPEVVSVNLSAGSTSPGVSAGTSVTLTANLNDTRYNNTDGTEASQTIAAAEYYIDTPPWGVGATPIAMSASDGSFNANIENVTATVATAGLSTGRHILYVRGRDAGNNWGVVSAIFLYIQGGGGGGNTAPTVTITAPANGSSFASGTAVSFTGTATDTQDGTISANLAWTSSINGAIGSGASFSTSVLAVGSHTITASVTDSGGLSGSATRSITITGGTGALTNGVPVTGIAGALNSSTFYTLAVPSGATNLSFVTSGGTPDVDLYVRFGSAPTTTTSDCSSTNGTSDETCSFATPSAGTYHVLLYGYSAYSGVTLTGSYTAPGGSVTVTLFSVAAQDGRLFESTETSGVGGTGNSTDNTTASLRVGDFSDDTQYKTLVSFDTSSIPDTATITAATLRLKRGTLSGTSPFTTHGTCTVDMSNAFGGSTAFAGADFQAAAAASGVATMSHPTTNGTFSTGSLNSTGLSTISKTGTTQFRVSFTLDDNDDLGSDYIGFYSGEAASGNKPELVITYTP